MKFISSCAVVLMPVILYGCNGHTEGNIAKKVEKVIKPLVTVKKPSGFPYEFVNIKREAKEKDGDYNVMRLYEATPPVNFDSLKMFCLQEKKMWEDGIINVVVFFDDKKNASFPKKPMTDMNFSDKVAKHITAFYWYTSFNGYRKLTCFKKNMAESRGFDIDLRD